MDYLYKSILISSVLFVFYKLFLERETFFQANRLYFVVGLLVSFFLPLLVIPIYIEVEPIALQALPNTSAFTGTTEEIILSPILKNTFDWVLLGTYIYFIGVVFLSLKLFLELFSLRVLIRKYPKKAINNIVFVKTDDENSPFSFFKWIVYNSNLFSKEELTQIINHEIVHVKQWHSIDMLMVQLFVILQWFNPLAWLYRKALNQNLEYIADQSATDLEANIKEYQYLLLKTSVAVSPFALPNKFFNSHLKKRIMMLQKTKSKRFNQLKYALLLPLLVVFMYAFNTKEIQIVKSRNTQEQISEEKPIFTSPINTANLNSISGYGMRVNPFTNKKQMHQGVDFKAPKGTDVLAAATGIVTEVSENKRYGKMIRIKHADDYESLYAHLSVIQIGLGEQLQGGEIIGNVGSTGMSVAPHLHFEIIKSGKNINPIYLIIFEESQEEPKQKGKSYSGLNFGITKNTTDKQIAEIIADEKQYNNLDVSITKLKRNNKAEITAIKISVKNKNTESGYRVNQNKPIPDIIIAYDKDRNEVVINDFVMSDGATKKQSSISNNAKLTLKQQNEEITSYQAINNNPIYHITASSSDADIQVVNDYFSNHFLKLHIDDIKRNDKGKIILYSISTKNKIERMSTSSVEKTIGDFSLQLSSDAKIIIMIQGQKDCDSSLDCRLILEIGEDTVISRYYNEKSESKEMGSVYFNKEKYYFTKTNDKYEFYTKFGEKVADNLVKELKQMLEKQ